MCTHLSAPHWARSFTQSSPDRLALWLWRHLAKSSCFRWLKCHLDILQVFQIYINIVICRFFQQSICIWTGPYQGMAGLVEKALHGKTETAACCKYKHDHIYKDECWNSSSWIYEYIYITFYLVWCIFHLHIDISTIQFIQCVDSTDPFVRFSYNKEPCTELIEFARAACRDDMEDGITAPRCPVITALNRIKSRNTEAWLDSTCIYILQNLSALTCMYVSSKVYCFSFERISFQT